MKTEVVDYNGSKMNVEIPQDCRVVKEGKIMMGDLRLTIPQQGKDYFEPVTQDDIGQSVWGYYCIIRKVEPWMLKLENSRCAEDKKMEKKVVGKWYACKIDDDIVTIKFDSLDEYKTFCCKTGRDWDKYAKELSNSEVEALAYEKHRIHAELEKLSHRYDKHLNKINKKIEKLVKKGKK
jgi:hypothetical protein